MTFDVKSAILGTPPITQIGDLVLDACVYISMYFDADITEHPVEEGANIADHHKPIPDVISIEGRISNSPISNSYPGATTVSSIKSIVNKNNSFVIDAQELLIKYRNESKLLELKTTRKPFSNMLITSLTFDQDALTKNKLIFNATFTKVRIVKTGHAGLLALGKDLEKKIKERDSNGDDGKSKQAKPKKDVGKQSTSNSSSSEGTKSRSILSGLIF
jgi:hypothetical protein